MGGDAGQLARYHGTGQRRTANGDDQLGNGLTIDNRLLAPPFLRPPASMLMCDTPAYAQPVWNIVFPRRNCPPRASSGVRVESAEKLAAEQRERETDTARGRDEDRHWLFDSV